ncbi:serine O-acetyltransferase [Chryseobacterium salivictor]|uniref:Serine acetyltransferase n=1 Tax=Chryseobacterium salivictor TaxID=2547600 RepID=A0A4P6ZIW5_9FLAO|nr:serine acetyltransferase [Chryseobacterium salivictor]QBO59679.1 Serine acetyltransferase [Chryseobacterium salivictor]
MISNTSEYLYYLECDKVALSMESKRPRYKHDIIWTFQRLLRKCEYFENTKKSFFLTLINKYHKYRYVSMSQKLGFSIGFNTFGPGLSIAHYGSLVVHSNAKIGVNCRIHENVTIGASGGSNKAPIIGDNVFIASGAKIIGDITIADGVCIGANAVVVKDILEPNVTVGGIPARKISNNNSDKYLIKATEIVKRNE